MELVVRPARHRPTKVPTAATGKSYLVVGGHGLLGSHVVEALLARGEEHVHIFDRATSPLFGDEVARGPVAFHAGDLRDASAVRDACSGIDTVIHTAASVDFWSDLPFEYRAIHEVNVVGTANVIDACVSEGVTQLLFASSAAVVVGRDLLERPMMLVDERTPRAAAPFLCHYIATKSLAEQALLAADGRGRLSTAALRPGGLFGPRDERITAGIARGAPGIGFGPNVIDHIYVENVVHAFLLLEARLRTGAPVCGQAYFVTNYEPSDTPRESYLEFNRRFAEAFGRRFRIAPSWLLSGLAASVEALVWASRGRARGALGELAMLRPASLALARGTYCFSHENATRDFGYAPLYSVAEAFALTAAHHRRARVAHRK